MLVAIGLLQILWHLDQSEMQRLEGADIRIPSHGTHKAGQGVAYVDIFTYYPLKLSRILEIKKVC